MTAPPDPAPGIGDTAPALRLAPTLEDLVRWAALADDYTAFHFDADDARERGFLAPVVHGTFQAAQVVRMLTDWLGPRARLVEVACRYRRPALVGDPMRCTARVVTVEALPGGGDRIGFEVAVESPVGTPVTTGTALVDLPAGEG